MPFPETLELTSHAIDLSREQSLEILRVSAWGSTVLPRLNPSHFLLRMRITPLAHSALFSPAFRMRGIDLDTLRRWAWGRLLACAIDP